MNEWPSVAEEEPVGSGSLVSSQFPSTRHTQYRNRVGRERFLHREPEVNLEGALQLLPSEGRIELKGTEQEGPAISFEAPCGSRSRVILGTGLPTAAPLVSLSSRNHESPALGQVPGEASLAAQNSLLSPANSLPSPPANGPRSGWRQHLLPGSSSQPGCGTGHVETPPVGLEPCLGRPSHALSLASSLGLRWH